MEDIGHRLVWHYVPFTDIELPLGGLNVVTVGNTLLVVLLLWLGLWWAARRLEWIPGRAQSAVEMMLEALRDLLESSVGPENRAFAQRALTLIVSLFIFILACNLIVLIPAPYIEEPTGDLNCTLALALLAMGYASYSGVRVRGLKGYLEELCGPMWHQPGVHGRAALPGRLSALFFFPLRLVEEFSRAVSLSCRLFGNIMGSAIVAVVISTLGYYLVIPVALNGLLVPFEAGLQAFVFASLTIVYLSTAVRPD